MLRRAGRDQRAPAMEARMTPRANGAATFRDFIHNLGFEPPQVQHHA